LESALPARLDGSVLEQIVAETGGSPLALLELPRGLSPAQLAGGFGLTAALPLSAGIEENFRRRLERLPGDARRLLLLAAADPLGDPALLWRAAQDLGVGETAVNVVESAGLLTLNGSATFRHPLVRSAVYRAATRSERREAHEALAAAVSDPVSGAWHRAVVADAPDEALAGALEAAAAQAVARTAHATAAVTFERAADLSEDEPARGRRLRGAAQASLDAGRLDAALALVARARPLTEDPGDAAHLDLIRATEAGRRGSPADGSTMLRDAARAVADAAPELATELALWSLFTGLQGGWDERLFTAGRNVLEVIDSDGPLGRFAGDLVDGLSAFFAGDAATAGARFAATLETGANLDGLRTLAMPVFVWAFTGDWPHAREHCARVVARLRAEGTVAGLVGVLPLLAFTEVAERRMREAQASAAEGLELARTLGYENDETGLLGVQARIAALHGDADACRESAQEALRRSVRNGVGWATTNARLALAEIEMGLGNPREAIAHFEQIVVTPTPPIVMTAVPDLIDAAVRAGDLARAGAALERFAAWAPVTRARSVHGMLARCRAILAEGDQAEALFGEALELHARETPPYERARTQLAYGERLRRDRRKTEARAQLRSALETFEGVGADLWAQRARGELNATGGSARKRDASTIDDLTPQELRIAQLVAAGASNRDAAAQLFVSPKTVEYHLRKVFLKLGLSSRIELARLQLAGADQGPD
jgi:DNA-binding CsgD family transcriptional regulator